MTLADGGLRVALVERELVGGECSYWGCIPSKTLLRPGEALAAARTAPGAREAIAGPLDVGAALAWRDFMVSDYDDTGALPWLQEKGIELLRGTGRLDGPGTVVVGGDRYSARHIVLATGSRAGRSADPGPGRARRRLDQPRGHGADRGAPPAAHPRRPARSGVETAQAAQRMGAEVAIVEGMDHVLPREPRALGEALGEALAAEGVELHFGQYAAAARRDGDDYVLAFPDGSELRGDRLLVATGRRPRTDGLGLETVGIERRPRRASRSTRAWRPATACGPIGDVTGIWPLTYVGKYQGRIAAANILGKSREASYDAVPRVVFTDPQAAAVGATEGERTATVAMSAVPRTATYTRAYAEHPGFLTLVSDGERLTGAYALGPEAGEWLQQATLAIRARVPLAVMRDTIQPFPTFSEAFVEALAGLAARVRGGGVMSAMDAAPSSDPPHSLTWWVTTRTWPGWRRPTPTRARSTCPTRTLCTSRRYPRRKWQSSASRFASGEVSVLRVDANAANGMALHPDGRLLVCEQGTRSSPARISLVDRATGEAETVVDGWGGLLLNSPNDVVVKRDGTVWFTDPAYGFLQGFRPAPALGDFVYRHGPPHGRDHCGGRGVRQAQRTGLLARRARPLRRRFRREHALGSTRSTPSTGARSPRAGSLPSSIRATPTASRSTLPGCLLGRAGRRADLRRQRPRRRRD